MQKPDKANSKEVGDAMRAAMRGKHMSKDSASFPIAVRLALWTEAIKSGLDPGPLQPGKSSFLKYLRWEALEEDQRSEDQYQKLLLSTPEFLRPLIRTEEP